jgi:prepilin-type N-terminal cleavage/methylation domain-containing protein
LKAMSVGFKKNHGFTMIEVIAVLVIISIIGAFLLSRASSTESYRLISEVGTLKGHLRYAQLRAMSDNVSWGIAYTNGSYTLQKNGAMAPSHLPNEDSTTHTFQSSVSITSGADMVSFDEWGSPGGSNISITLSTGTDSRTITVTQNTGFIP